MPKMTFKCQTCGACLQKVVDLATKNLPCSCGQTMDRQLPKMNGPAVVHECPDRESGKKLLEDHDQVISERKLKYFYEVEVPRMVASGQYSLQTMLENQWVTQNEDGTIVINTKPPSLR